MATVIHNSSIVATLLRETPKPVLLLGSGASVTSGIPLAGEMVSKAAKWAYARQNGKDPEDPRITRSDWYPWLMTQTWFREDVPLASLFPYAIQNLLQPEKTRKDFWIKILNPDVPISIGYLRLVELMHIQKISNVLTTNFDDCLIKARTEINRPHHIDVIKTPSDYTKISSTPSYPSLIYLHGAVENYTDRNVIEEVQKMDENLVQQLIPILKDYPLIVIGYRGFEASIMQHLLSNNAERAFNFKNGIYWCIRRGEKNSDMTDYVKNLAQQIGPNFQYVEIESFDHLLDKVIWSHLEEQKMKLAPRILSVRRLINTDIKNFDLKPQKQYEVDDFDNPLLRIRITNYCSRLNISVPERADDSWLKEQMISLNLIRTNETGVDYTTNAGLLLFSKTPQKFISTAKILIRFIGNNLWLRKILDDPNYSGEVFEKTIEGNLWNQLNEVTNALTLVNRQFRLKSEKSENVLPYDPIALKEVIVNSFVHRDYEINEINIIEIYADKIVVKNPGGLTDEVKPYFEDEIMYEEIKKGRRGIKGYRNPVLADLFYSSGDMDKRGSGLYDVVTRINQNSGFVEFGPNLENTKFQVEIWSRPEAIDEVTNTASPISVVTTKFSTNIIEIKQIPQTIYFAPSIYSKAKDIFETYPSISFPPFHLHERYIFSFSDLRKSHNTLRNLIETREINSLALDEFLASNEGDKRFIWMLNDYFQSHLYSLGLIIDKERKRAYFPKTQEGERTISYQARLKKATRTIVRPRYSRNKEKLLYWEHKAFNYSIKRFGDEWGVLIEPTYVFTLNGEKFLLFSKRVGALATRKVSRDYNINVLNDTTFWLWILANGASDVFKLRASDIERIDDDIILSHQYLTTTLNYVENLEASDENSMDLSDDEDIDEEIALIAEQERQENYENQ